MALSDIILRSKIYHPLVTKGSELTWEQLDTNFIAIYQAILEFIGLGFSQALARVLWLENATNGDTFTITFPSVPGIAGHSVVFTFRTSATLSNDVQIAGTSADTRTNFITTVSNVSGSEISITYDSGADQITVMPQSSGHYSGWIGNGISITWSNEDLFNPLPPLNLSGGFGVNPDYQIGDVVLRILQAEGMITKGNMLSSPADQDNNFINLYAAEIAVGLTPLGVTLESTVYPGCDTKGSLLTFDEVDQNFIALVTPFQYLYYFYLGGGIGGDFNIDFGLDFFI